MMVLDLRAFDTAEGVSFNELFKLVPNSFENPDFFGNPDKFENLEIFVFPARSDILGSRTPVIYTYFFHYLVTYIASSFVLIVMFSIMKTFHSKVQVIVH